MNREIVERIYHEAAASCVKEGKSIAWIFEEKFAELIVKKCADIAAVNQAEHTDWDIAEIILEYFGIKE